MFLIPVLTYPQKRILSAALSIIAFVCIGVIKFLWEEDKPSDWHMRVTYS